MTLHVLRVLYFGLCLFLELCQHPKDTWDPTATISHPLSSYPLPWKPWICLCWMDLLALDTLCKWNCSIYVFFLYGFPHFPQPLQVRLGNNPSLFLPALRNKTAMRTGSQHLGQLCMWFCPILPAVQRYDEMMLNPKFALVF